jgi:TusA-related sulfurtransferase
MAKATVNETLIVNITDSDTLIMAKAVKELHTKLGEVETEFSEGKDGLSTRVKAQWESETKETFLFPRNYKADTGLGIIQVEAKVITAKGVVEASYEKELDKMFGGNVDKLFEKSKVVDQVMDKRAILHTILTNPAVNLNDIEITIKSTSLMELIEKESKGALTTKEVILPKAGFLEALADLPEAMRKSTYGFVKAFLDKCMRFDVVCGNRGKKA